MSVNHKNPTKVVTGVVRLSYANVWEPASINGSNPKYSVSLIIPDVYKRQLLALPLTEFAGGNVVVFPNHVERRTVIISNLLISDFTVEIHVMRQHEQLLDVVAWNFRIQVLGIVPADVDHLTDDCTDEEQGCAIHAGYRIIDNDDLLFDFLAAHAATNLMVEVQECDEVTLAFTEVFGHGAILADNLIYIFYTGLGTCLLYTSRCV